VIADAGAATDKARGTGGAAQSSDQQAASPATTSSETAIQATSDTASGSTPSGADRGNGSDGSPQSAAQAPAHAPESSAQSHPDQTTPAQAATTTATAASVAAGPTPQVATASATAATVAAPGPARYGVGLEHAIETVKTTIELGSRQGFSQAKIQLAPASLGAITIHLQKTSDGIIARVVAEHSAAAQTMQQGGDDLRRSLQSSGMTLLRLDIETRGDQRGSAGENGRTAGSGSGQPGADDEPAATTDNSSSQQTTLVLPNGALVNVLA
jgi:flagellar hook-length control protein FliK